MTAVVDSHDPTYRDEKATRDELTRVFDVCGGCRACVDLCPSFDSLFELLGPPDQSDAGRLSPAQQDVITDRCFHCDACVTACDHGVDLPTTLVRARSMRRATGQWSTGERFGAWIVGRHGDRLSAVINAVSDAPAGSFRRRVVRVLTGLTANRELPRTNRALTVGSAEPGTGAVVVYPTCQAGAATPGITRAFRRAGIDCSTSAAGCCGAASLHAGDVSGFARRMGDATAVLATDLANADTIVVGDPACAGALRRHAVDHVAPGRRSDAQRVAAAVRDPADLLLDRAASLPSLVGRVVTVHEQAPGSSAASAALFEALGAKVRLATVATGVTSRWHLRASHDEVADTQRTRLVQALAGAPGDIVGSAALANAAVSGATGRPVFHPAELWASDGGDASEPAR